MDKEILKVEDEELDVFKVLWKWKFAIMIFSLIVVVVSGIYSKFITRIYQAESIAFISYWIPDTAEVRAEEKRGDSLADPSGAAGFIALATHIVLLKRVIDRLGLKNGSTEEPMYPETLKSIVEVGSVIKGPATAIKRTPGSRGKLIALRVKGTDPKVATDIVNAWADIWADENRRIKTSKLKEVTLATRILYNQAILNLKNEKERLKILSKKTVEILEKKLENRRQQMRTEPVFFIPEGVKTLTPEYPPLNENRVLLSRAILNLENEIKNLTAPTEPLMLFKLGERKVQVDLQEGFTNALKIRDPGHEMENKVKETTYKIMEVLLAEMRLGVAANTVIDLSGKLASYEVKLSGMAGDIRIILPAIVPNFPISPDVKKIVFYAGIGSFMLASIVAILREHLYS